MHSGAVPVPGEVESEPLTLGRQYSAEELQAAGLKLRSAGVGLHCAVGALHFCWFVGHAAPPQVGVPPIVHEMMTPLRGQ
jgi:hypothetical protein